MLSEKIGVIKNEHIPKTTIRSIGTMALAYMNGKLSKGFCYF